MAAAPTLSPEMGLGLSVPTLVFQNQEATVSVVGQKLKFAPCASLTELEAVWHAGSSPHGISVVAACPKAKLFAFTERTLEPRVFVFSHPDMLQTMVLDLPTELALKTLEFTALAFSRNGEHLAGLCGLPDPTLVVWSTKTQMVLVSGPLLVPTSGLSFDPAGGGLLCTHAPKRLLVWNLKLVYTTYLLDSTEIPPDEPLPADDDDKPTSGMWTAHAWAPSSALYVSSDTGVVTRIVNGTPTAVLRFGAAVHALLADTTHLLVGADDGFLRWYGLLDEEADEEASLLWQVGLESGVRSLCYAPDFRRLLASTSSGEVHLLEYASDELPFEPLEGPVTSVVTTERVSAFHTAAVVAASPLPVVAPNGETEYEVVACSLDGTVRCFHALTRMQIASISSASAEPPSALATSAASMLVALGTADGVLRLYVRESDEIGSAVLSLVWRGKVSSSALTQLAFSADGKQLASACADGTLLMLKLAGGADEPTLLPHATAPCAPATLAWTRAGSLLVGLSDGKLLVVTPPSGAAGETFELGECPSVMLETPAAAIVEAPSLYPGAADGSTYVFAACADRGVYVYAVPKAGSGGATIDPVSEVAKPAKPPTALALSLDDAFLGIGASDGSLVVCSTKEPSPLTSNTLMLHDSVLGGIAAIVFVPDLTPSATPGDALAFTCGKDGTMVLTTVSPAGLEEPPPLPVVPPLTLAFAPAADKGPNLPPPADADDGEMEIDVGDEVDEAEADGADELTVMEAAKVASTSGLAESADRDALAEKVDGLRAELLDLIAANAKLDDDDLEKLQPVDFIIDLEQQERWRAEGTAQVNALKASIADENLSNELVSARMKSEFWESMAEPAVTLHAMVVPGVAPGRQQGLKVSSYTVPRAQESTTRTLGVVNMLRTTELKIDAWEAADSGVPLPAYRTANAFESAATFAQDIGRVQSASELRANAEAKEAKAADAKGEGKKDEKAAAKKEEEGDADADADAEGGGGDSAAAAGDGKKLYAPFEVHTRWRKVSQMALNGEVQGQLKAEFNEKLKANVNHKRAELEKIGEKQARIAEIEEELARLGAASDGEQPLELGMHADEEPEKLLEVLDSEVNAEKYVSKEERARLAKLEEERLAREAAAKGDNLGQRGLMVMMDGTLETRKDEDEIFIDLVKPEALLRQEAGEDLTDDEKALVKEFMDKQKKLDAEREKRSKGLLTELAKLRLDISDICNNYNERVKTLRETKMVFDGAIYESELLVIRLAQARLNKEAFEKKLTDLEAELAEQRTGNQDSMVQLEVFNKQLNEHQHYTEELVTEDKQLDKAFKRDFGDQPEFLEQLKKLYARRKTQTVPKGQGNKASAPPAAPSGGGPSMLGFGRAMTSDAFGGADAAGDTGLVFGGRDPFAALDEPETEQMVEPLDAAVDMPEGLSFDVWDRLVEARTQKLQSEETLKEVQGTLSQMQEYQQLVKATDDKLRSRIDVLASTLGERREHELREDWNLELPFKLKQGQVEVEEAAVVTDYGGALLIHRDNVAELNGSVRQLGHEKVDILKEIRDFRKGIVMLEWENQRADMEAEDLVERTKEFQLLRVTKDLQGKIRGGSEENQQVEVAALEKKLEQLKAAHEDKVADLRRQVAKINAMIADRTNEMGSLDGQIGQLEGSVLEREMIHEIQSQNKDATGDGFKRFEELHMKRKLQTLVGMQTQEIGLLRDELDRLRRRTFPTFTHIDARASADRAL